MFTHVLTLVSMLALSISLHAGSLTPSKGWRVNPSLVVASSAASQLGLLNHGEDASWQPDLSRSEWIAFRLPEPGRFLLTFSVNKAQTPVYAVLERRTVASPVGHWETAQVLLPKARLDKFAFDRGEFEWWRIRFTFRQKDQPSEFKVTDIGLYSLDVPRPDYWIDIGASIQAQSIRNSVFKRMVKERFPGYDPVMFNLAVGGWNSVHLRKALPGFLKDHPDAQYVCIHIGGNNVTPNRPYPGGADQLKDDLVAILTMIRDAGKIPILSRLSYRAYKGAKPVPPEENGSGPYVTAIYDPLIKQYCPDFFDDATGKGIVDAYTWFKEHPEELSADGVHVNPTGAESWNRLWAERAGGVVYRKP
jgi:lysophospholipase L1-like esterase